jgi:hypothetical protein
MLCNFVTYSVTEFLVLCNLVMHNKSKFDSVRCRLRSVTKFTILCSSVLFIKTELLAMDLYFK